MSILRTNISVKARADEVAPFVDAVQRQADTERDALGFLPPTAYQEAAVQGKLWVAVVSDQENETYVGHLLFGGAFPTLRVFQLFVGKAYRNCGVASVLIDHLVADAEAHSFLSISAKVADDLDANRFWERKGFSIVRSRVGGATRGRLILLREKRLSTPTLFDLLNTSTSPTDHDLRLAERLYVRSPVFAIDLNVLIDVVQNRPRAIDVRKIISAAMTNTVRLCVAPEFINELQNASLPNCDDPLLDFAAGLPQFPIPPELDINRTVMELGSIVFPEKTRQGRLKARDQSDLRHLATAIHHRAAGFVTSEKAILRCQRLIRERFELDVVGPTELAEALTPAEWTGHEHVTAGPSAEPEIVGSEVREEERQTVERFLGSLGVNTRTVADALAAGHRGSPRRRLIIAQADGVHAFASWDAPQRVTPCVDAFLFAGPEAGTSEAAVDHALFVLMRDACSHGPTVVRLCARTADVLVERLAASCGFRPTTVSKQSVVCTYQKICLGKAVSETNWATVREALIQLASVELPQQPPKYRGPGTPIPVVSPQSIALCLPLHELEELLGPALLLLPERPAAIVPIRPNYAAQLLDTSPQSYLFPKYEAGLLFQRVYFSSARALSALSPGTILFFYESKKDGGRGAVVACGRATAASIRPLQDVAKSVRRRGVLEDGSLKKIGQHGGTGVTMFDTVMKFSVPVPLGRLREIGCADGSNLVTSRRIRHDQMRTILAHGQPSL